MKIIQVISQLGSGGAERFTVNLCNELYRAGHEVHLLTFKGVTENYEFNKQYLVPGVRCHSFNLGGKPYLKLVCVFNQVIKEIRPDVIHCHLQSPQYLLPVICFSNIKVIHTLHSVADKSSGGWNLHTVLYYLLYKVKKLIPVTISEICHDSYSSFFKMNNDIMIPNGSVPAEISLQFEYVKHEIDGYKNSDSTMVFIHVARFNNAKNQQLLIDAFNAIANMGIDYTLLVVGRGFDSAEGLQLKKNACNNIHFLGEKSNVGDYLACSDAFCLTSEYEGLPISLLEAMSLGVIPICTAVGGIKDVIKDGVTGFLAEKVELQSYVDAVMRFLNTPVDRDLIVREFHENYSMEECARRYMSVYSSEK